MGCITVGLGWDVDQGEVDLDVSAVGTHWKWRDGIMKILDDQHFPIYFPWFSRKKLFGFPYVVTYHHFYVGKMMGKWWWSGIGSNLLICIDEDHRMRHGYGKSHDKTQGWRVGRSWMIQVCYRPSLIYFGGSIVALSVVIHRKISWKGKN